MWPQEKHLIITIIIDTLVLIYNDHIYWIITGIYRVIKTN